MKPEDISSIAQLVESMNLAVSELEKANEKNLEKAGKIKIEILNFQKKIQELIGNGA